MLAFPCRCGHRFELPDNQAGGFIQCPDCGLLNDIPLLSEVDSLLDDGTYEIDAGPIRESPTRMQELQRAFGADRTDGDGQEIDLREPVRRDHARRVEPLDRVAPKYDPVTGELVRPIEIETTERFQRTEPLPTSGIGQPLGYARGKAISHTSPFRILLEAFSPVNVVAMTFVLLAHFAANIVGFAPFFGLVAFIILFCGIIGHYGKIIEAMGPEENDEFPRMFGNVSFGDDIFRPFGQMLLALLLTYGMAILLTNLLSRLAPDLSTLIWFVLFWGATLIFPATALTVMTSGSLHNLRPDRVIQVALLSGMPYLMATIFWVLGMAAYVWRWMSPMAIPASVRQTAPWLDHIPDVGLRFGLLLGAIYCMHIFSWELGLAYRSNHHRFPWVLQRYIPTRRDP